MSEHRLSPSGVCQRCGAENAEHVAAPCKPRVIFIPSKNTVQDFIRPTGTTFINCRTLADYLPEYPDAVVMDADDAYARHEAEFIKGVTETTEERFNYALEVLPPGKWGHYQGGEAFYVTERITGNIVSWYFRVSGRFFTLDDNAAAHPSVYLSRVSEYIAAHPVQ